MIKHKYCMLLVTAALAACGSKSSSKATTPVATVEAPEQSEQAGSAAAPEPTAAEPAAPEEPARPNPEQIKADLLAAEIAAFDAAKPVFEKNCASCHTTAGKKASKKKLADFTMDSYPFGGEHAATMGAEIREVMGLSGKKATMPWGKAGSVKGDDLASIKAWADAWEAAEKGGAHAAATGY
jgi:mono/diheme cytochrome c family protein